MSMYEVYIDDLKLPWGVPKLTTTFKNRNKEVELMNGEVMSLPRSPGLTTWKFETILPKADKYLDKFEDLKLSKKPFRFIVNRGSRIAKEIPNPDYKEDDEDKTQPKTITIYEEVENGENHTTNIFVTLEDFEREESSDYAKMSKVTLTLKEYRSFSTSYVEIEVPEYVEDKVEKRILVSWKEKKRLEALNPPTEVVAKVTKEYAEFDFEGEHFKEFINEHYATWKDVTIEAFGDDKYWEEVRDTNSELRWDKEKHHPGYYGVVKKYPGDLYPIPESVIKININSIVNLYHNKRGKQFDVEVYYE